MIEVRNLTKRYGPHTAVDGLTFTIREGQVLGFLGPNGAGKTTTMNMLAGYLPPTEGSILIGGTDLAQDSIKAKQMIGYLPEVPPLYPDLTVTEELLFMAGLRGVPRTKRQEEVRRVMEKMDLEAVKTRLIRNLSKGYRQRCGMAQAMIGDPDILLLDEPTSGLDPRQITEMRALIKELGKKHTVLVSSHILSEVSEICDTVLILSEGKIAASGTPSDLARENTGTRVRFLTKGTEGEIREALRTIPAGKTLQTWQEGELRGAELSGSGEGDIRAAVSKALFAAGLPVYEIRAEKRSLEDIFLMKTKKGTQSEGEKERADDL